MSLGWSCRGTRGGGGLGQCARSPEKSGSVRVFLVGFDWQGWESGGLADGKMACETLETVWISIHDLVDVKLLNETMEETNRCELGKSLCSLGIYKLFSRDAMLRFQSKCSHEVISRTLLYTPKNVCDIVQEF